VDCDEKELDPVVDGGGETLRVLSDEGTVTVVNFGDVGGIDDARLLGLPTAPAPEFERVTGFADGVVPALAGLFTVLFPAPTPDDACLMVDTDGRFRWEEVLLPDPLELL
jgi:hypothetical protein